VGHGDQRDTALLRLLPQGRRNAGQGIIEGHGQRQGHIKWHRKMRGFLISLAGVNSQHFRDGPHGDDFGGFTRVDDFRFAHNIAPKYGLLPEYWWAICQL